MKFNNPIIYLFFLVLIISLSGCGTIPSDMLDVTALASRSETMSDAEILQIQNKPLPEQTGLAYDLALMRRAMAARFRGDLATLRTTSQLANEHATDPNFSVQIMVLLASSERANGNWRAAEKTLADTEKRLQRLNKKTGKKIYETDAGLSFLTEALHASIWTNNTQYTNRLIKRYAKPAISDLSQPLEKRIYIQMYLDDASLIKRSQAGEPLQAYYDRLENIERYRSIIAKQLDPEASQTIAIRRKILDFQLHAGQDAITAGEPSLAFQRLEAIENSKSSSLFEHSLHADDLKNKIFWFIGDYQQGLEQLSDSWSRLPPGIRRLPVIRTAYSLQQTLHLAALGHWEQAARELQNVDPAAPAIQARHLRIGLGALIESVLGSQATEFERFRELWQQYANKTQGLDATITYMAAATIIFHRRYLTSNSRNDLRFAIRSGRQLAKNYRLLHASGYGAATSLPQSILGMAKEAYVLSVDAGLRKKIASKNNLVDAFQLLQMSEIDRNIAATLARLRNVPGLSDSRLRQLQDAKRKHRAAEWRLATSYQIQDIRKQELRRLENRVARARNELNQLIGSSSRSGYKALAIEGEIAPLSGVQVMAKLSRREALVGVAPMEQSSIVLVVTSEGIYHQIIPLGRAAIDNYVNSIRASLERADSFNFTSASQLYNAIFGWSGQYLNGVDSIVVAASGSLAGLPFGLFISDHSPNTVGADFAKVPWLIKRFAVAQAPSLFAWAATAKTRARSRGTGLAAWADPDFSGLGQSEAALSRAAASDERGIRLLEPDTENNGLLSKLLNKPIPKAALDLNSLSKLRRLHGTRREVDSISSLLGDSVKKDLLFGMAATRSSVLRHSESGALGERNIVVFATHGLAPADVVGLYQPSLVFAKEGASPQQQLLKLEDVLGLRLNADWVILSACNTGSADKQGGDPLSGLARGFLFAGARGMLITHWNVSDNSAAHITSASIARFAQQKGMSRSKALQRTAIDMIEGNAGGGKWTHPYHWAAYTFVGAND